MITNKDNVSIALIPWLLRNDYDGCKLPNAISATTLLKSTKQVILSRRVKNKVIDVLDYVNARRGSSIHDSVEKSWTENPQLNEIMEAVGYPSKVYERIKINPTNPDPSDINIFLEQRMVKELMGYNINGKFDIVMEGRLMDVKTTSVYSYIFGKNDKNYQLQGSIYRWLNPKLITDEHIYIQMIFTDWAKAKVGTDNYPPAPIVEVKIPLLSLQETERFILNKISLIEKYKDSPEEDIPDCNDEELWKGDPTYKVYKNAESKRATKTFTSLKEAQAFVAQGGGTVLKTIGGEAKACNYCYAQDICKQRLREIGDEPRD